MKHLILLLSLVFMAACSQPSGGPSGSTGLPSPANISFPTPGPSPAPSPVPSPAPAPSPTPAPSCAPFLGTDWIPSGLPNLTPESQDQTGKPIYIPELDMTGSAPQFTEQQYVGAPLNELTCIRDFNSGVSTGVPYSLVWSDTSGYCGAVAQWVSFDLNSCNVLTVTIRDGMGNTYLTQTYSPR